MVVSFTDIHACCVLCNISVAPECSSHSGFVDCLRSGFAYFFTTYYVVTQEGMLLIRCGFFPKKQIAIADIEALQPSILPVSSYALSLDRIIIWKEGKMWMLVSPQNEQEFARLLKKFNPGIEIRKNSGLL